MTIALGVPETLATMALKGLVSGEGRFHFHRDPQDEADGEEIFVKLGSWGVEDVKGHRRLIAAKHGEDF